MKSNPIPPLFLASASPRRREILSRLGVPFSTIVPDVDEKAFSAASAEDLARTLALGKAQEVHNRCPTSTVLGADTVVSLDGVALGKPAGPDDAQRMLFALRGRTHTVVTGMALISEDGAAPVVQHVSTRVTMRPYTLYEIDRYVESGDPLDKAGAYAIQDADFHPVASFDGCYWNVVGLPACQVVDAFRRAGFRIVPDGALTSQCTPAVCPLLR